MGDVGRDIAQIGVGIIGGIIGAQYGNPTMGFAIATTLFSIVAPPETPDVKTPRVRSNGDQATAIKTPIWQIYGTYERVGADLMRVGKDSSGQRSGIEEVTRTRSSGAGSGVGDVATKETVSYLHCSVCPCAGIARPDRIIETNSKDGEKVVYDRFNSLGTVLADELRALLQSLEDNENDLVACAPIQADLIDFYEAHGDKQGIKFTPVFGAVSGQLIAELSDKVSMYFGSYEQSTDPTEESWYPEGVSADRGKCKIVYNRYGPLEPSTNFKYLLTSKINNRREIIKHRLMLANIPESRINLRSIDEDAVEDGWYCDEREAARVLAEQVAAISFHDIHFMATEQGLSFTDVSRANPTFVVLDFDELGAFPNNDGRGQIPSIVNNNIQTPERKPRELSTDFNDINANYKKDSALSIWTAANGAPQSITLRCAAGLQKIQDFTDVAMAELQAAEGTETVTLMPNRAQVACGCVLIKPQPTEDNPNAYRMLRIIAQSVSPECVLSCTCVPYDPAAYGRARTVEINPQEPPVYLPYGIPTTVFIDGVSLLDFMADAPTVLAGAYVQPGELWRGALVTNEVNAFADFETGAQIAVGTLETDYEYEDEALYVRDYETNLEITMLRGVLASTTEELAAQGANLLYCGGLYFNFETATALGDGVYQITGIMPGIKGSDFIRAIESGSPVYQITDENNSWMPGIVPVRWSLGKLRTEIEYQTYAAGDASKTAGPETVQIDGISLKALAVDLDVHKADDGAGGYDLTFYARTRYAEAQEAYWNGIKVRWSDPLSFEVTLLDGVTVVDTRIVDATDGEIVVNYTEAELIDWFGSVPATLSGTIIQQGTYGEGFTREFSGV